MTKKSESETAQPPERLFKDRADLIAYLEYAVTDAAAFNATSASLLIMAVTYLEESAAIPRENIACKLS